MSPPTRAALRLAIAQTVRDLRLRRGLTVQQLAARADLDVDDLLALEAGRPSRAGDDLIAHYLQLRPCRRRLRRPWGWRRVRC